jgi:hypothetical protein
MKKTIRNKKAKEETGKMKKKIRNEDEIQH